MGVREMMMDVICTPRDFEGGTIGTEREFYIFFIDYNYTKDKPTGVHSPEIAIALPDKCIHLQDQRHVVGDFSQWDV